MATVSQTKTALDSRLKSSLHNARQQVKTVSGWLEEPVSFNSTDLARARREAEYLVRHLTQMEQWAYAREAVADLHDLS